MSTWEARVSRGTAPAERVDAELRYAFAAPLLRDAALWVDLGCGTGVPAGAALAAQPSLPGAVLVDHSAEALAEARRECGAKVVEAVEADLETTAGAAAVREAIDRSLVDGPIVVTCFGVLHQLADFTALVELLLELGERATVILSVPDDAAGALEDPHRRSAWSAGAAEELRRLLPEGALAFRQVPVRAAAIVAAQGGERLPLGGVDVPADPSPATHLLAFGDRAATLAPAARACVADLEAERADVRRRESDLAYLEARLAALQADGAD